MVNQLKFPTLFFTLSGADTRWYELQALMPGGIPDPADPGSLTMPARNKTLMENPILAAFFFPYRLNSSFKNILANKFKIIDHWGRMKDQHRGSLPWHGFLWSADAPDVSNLDGKTADELFLYSTTIQTSYQPSMTSDKTSPPKSIHAKYISCWLTVLIRTLEP